MKKTERNAPQNKDNNPYLKTLRELIIRYTLNHKIKVYLFGSRAQGREHKLSDVDIAILPAEPLSPGFIASLREKIEESTIPYSVDIIDLSQVDASFRKKILAEAIEWKD